MNSWLLYLEELTRLQILLKNSTDPEEAEHIIGATTRLLSNYILTNRKFKKDGIKVFVNNGFGSRVAWHPGIIRNAVMERVGPKGEILYRVDHEGWPGGPIGSGVHPESRIKSR